MTRGADSSSRGVVLTARGISKRFGRRAVLTGVDVELHAGELVALLGPNGCGKTTLMSILVKALRADQGSVECAGTSPGWVPQGGGTYGRLTVRENLELFAAMVLPDEDRHQCARTTAEAAHLMPWFDQPTSSLSGGTRQRLNIAIGMLGSPTVTVLDEPTTGVDLAHQSEMWALLRGRIADGGTVLYSTHNTADAALADRVLVLVQGTIVYSGPLEGVAQFAPEHATSFADLDATSRGLLALWGEVS